MGREILVQIRMTREEDTGKLKKSGAGAGAGAEVVISCFNNKRSSDSRSSVNVDWPSNEEFVTFSSFFSLLQFDVSKSCDKCKKAELLGYIPYLLLLWSFITKQPILD